MTERWLRQKHHADDLSDTNPRGDFVLSQHFERIRVLHKRLFLSMSCSPPSLRAGVEECENTKCDKAIIPLACSAVEKSRVN